MPGLQIFKHIYIYIYIYIYQYIAEKVFQCWLMLQLNSAGIASYFASGHLRRRFKILSIITVQY
jgi:hypothetical protein